MDKVILVFIVGLTIFAANTVRAQDVVVAETESTIESKTLQVLRISDRWIWLDAVDYGWKRFNIPDNFSFIIDSEAVSLDKIVVGQKLNVYITRTETGWILLSEPGGVEAVEDTNKKVMKPRAKRKGKAGVTRTPDGYIISTETSRAWASEPDAARAVEDTNEMVKEFPTRPIVMNMEVVATMTMPSDYIINTGTTRLPASEPDGVRTAEDTETRVCVVLPGYSTECHSPRADSQKLR